MAYSGDGSFLKELRAEHQRGLHADGDMHFQCPVCFSDDSDKPGLYDEVDPYEDMPPHQRGDHDFAYDTSCWHCRNGE